jgi:hypothetical protein
MKMQLTRKLNKTRRKVTERAKSAQRKEPEKDLPGVLEKRDKAKPGRKA